ncbi:polysaccharide biosynthesis/export family protein [Synoicihabitans lomoniglobus]|uniref:SLBB domain-containing protein n=1 Tax=Synoicihabitans lomoniglobus TaxID=2909285 RepID=A0AAE9ZW30_9BACT|nr:SLBB domain-containing protein [Opitutaceae bacterium LMO-M01]WED64154.1 SLBB domain-containing protein [Opitutaceae bacterium LMO-M01]
MALFLALFCSFATAQSTDSPPPFPSSQAPIRFDINFPGGSAHALVEMLQEVSGEPVNAFIPATASPFVLPPLSYRNVTVEEVLAPLRWFQNVAILHDGVIKSQREGYEWGLDRGIWVMQVQTVTNVPDIFEVEPVNIRRLLAHYSIDDLTTAVDSAWKLQGAPSESALLFHPETSLLILKGRRLDLETARKVLQNLAIDETVPEVPSLDVHVLGAVNKPGSYAVPAKGTLIDAIAQAGGVTRLADRRKVTIRRENESPSPSFEVNLYDILNGAAPATSLQSGDTIFVTERIR